MLSQIPRVLDRKTELHQVPLEAIKIKEIPPGDKCSSDTPLEVERQDCPGHPSDSQNGQKLFCTQKHGNLEESSEASGSHCHTLLLRMT